jgi:hypothetical protein
VGEDRCRAIVKLRDLIDADDCFGFIRRATIDGREGWEVVDRIADADGGLSRRCSRCRGGQARARRDEWRARKKARPSAQAGPCAQGRVVCFKTADTITIGRPVRAGTSGMRPQRLGAAPRQARARRDEWIEMHDGQRFISAGPCAQGRVDRPARCAGQGQRQARARRDEWRCSSNGSPCAQGRVGKTHRYGSTKAGPLRVRD